jgi:hypothetical protein
MLSCDACQAQTLEFLYDLLEGSELQAFADHLQGCPACQAALERARGQKTLLATAAKVEFATVRFQPPVEEADEAAAPVVVPLERRPLRAWRKWAVAAAALLMVGLGGACFWFGRDYGQARRASVEHAQLVERINQRLRDTERQILDVPRQTQDKIAAIHQEVAEKQLKVIVTGPATVQSGAPADYQIQTFNLAGQSSPARLSARVVDQARGGATLLDLKEVATGGNYRLTLPPDLPVKPDSRLALVVSAKREGGSEAELREELQLGAPVYVTHLMTDKPTYQPGETVRFRSLTLDRFSLKPADADFRLHYVLTMPNGEERIVLQAANALRQANATNGTLAEVLGPNRKPLRGVGAGEVVLDANAPGGEYVLTVREEMGRFPEEKRKFNVLQYQKPRLNKELDYSRKTYGPGDEVQALCKVTRADNGQPLRGSKAEATVQIDGKTYGRDGKEDPRPIPFQTDDEGKVAVRFRLPEQMERGQASLAVTFSDGANTETILRPIPILLKKLKVNFYPEGGDLVAGWTNRVYFEAKTTLGKPADLKGRILEDGQPLPGEVETLNDAKEPGVNQGMGRFAFTPKAGHKYELRVDSPVGITERYPLPDVKADGIVLTVKDGVVKTGQPIRLTIQGGKDRSLLVGVYCRGRLLDSAHLKEGQTEMTLQPQGNVGGVCRVTVFEEKPTGGPRPQLVPRAERLIYREPAERVNVTIRPDRKDYVPGQKVTLDVSATNEKGESAPAVAVLAVVDKSVVTMADEKTARSMPTHFLLTTEVYQPEDLEYADFLLGSHPKAAAALDLLLGVQGWRRFAEQNPAKFREKHKEEAERLLVTIGQSTPRITEFAEEKIKQAQKEGQDRAAALEKQYDEARDEARSAEADAGYAAAVAKLAKYRQFADRALAFGLPLLGVLLLILCLVLVALNLARTLARVIPAYLGVAACMAVLLIVVRLQLAGDNPALDQHQVAALKPGEVEAEVRKMAEVAAPDAGKAEGKLMPMMAPGGRGFGGAVPPPPAAIDNLPRGGAAMVLPPPMAPVPAVAGRAAMRAPAAARVVEERAKNLAAGRGLADDKKMNAAAFKQVELAAGAKGAAKADRDAQMGLRAMPQAGPVKDQAVVRRMQMGKAAGGLPAGGFGGEKPQRPLEPAVVREYAHHWSPGASAGTRSDFAETLYWHPALVVPEGGIKVSFDLCDSVTTFQATAYAHTIDGRLGSVTTTFDSRLPFTLQPKTPIEVTASDRIDVPLSIANNTTEDRAVNLTLDKFEGLALLAGKANERFDVPAGKPVRKVFRFQPTIKEGEAVLTFAGKADPFAADAVRGSFRIVPEGFPVVGSVSDVLEKSASSTILLPQTWVKGTLKCQVQVYPSTLADLQKGLDALLREPCGCFEQTSTSNYPNLLILDYLKESDQAKPEVERRARDLLARGYQKLTSFECQKPGGKGREGYEWFGGTAPPHEALTAYGLLEFRDMARVYDVDPTMLQRTKDYLLSQRDGKGGFKRNPRALDTFGRAPEDVTNAYIVWALTESGKDDDVTKELDALANQAKKSKDPYFLALVANSLVNRARTGDGIELLKTVAAAQKDDGHLDAERTSITGSGGRDLQIETTSLAVLGWLKANPGAFNANVQKAIRWIGQQRGGYGGFGSTQSTILALKALIAFAKANKKTPEAGTLELFVGDRLMAKKDFPAGAAEAITLDLPEPEKNLQSGKNAVRVEITGKNVFPYTLTWSYQTLQPASAEGCPVRLKTALARTELKEGDAVRLTVKLENVSGKGQGMAVAIVGLPGGLTVPEDLKQLKEHAKEPTDGSRPLISFFELRGRELVLYWRDLAPGQKIEVPVDLIGRVPGEYSGPASRAYLYYNADHKHWVEPLKATIAAKE